MSASRPARTNAVFARIYISVHRSLGRASQTSPAANRLCFQQPGGTARPRPTPAVLYLGSGGGPEALLTKWVRSVIYQAREFVPSSYPSAPRRPQLPAPPAGEFVPSTYPDAGRRPQPLTRPAHRESSFRQVTPPPLAVRNHPPHPVGGSSFRRPIPVPGPAPRRLPWIRLPPQDLRKNGFVPQSAPHPPQLPAASEGEFVSSTSPLPPPGRNHPPRRLAGGVRFVNVPRPASRPPHHQKSLNNT